jgi:hypothetical protein
MSSIIFQSSQGKPLPQFVRDMLSCPPNRGGGLHNWLFRTARVLHPFRSRDEIIALLEAATSGEPVQSGEIENAVDNSVGCAWTPGAISTIKQKASLWLSLDEAKRAEIIASGIVLSDLFDLSPWCLKDKKLHSEDIIENLFPGDPLLCCGITSSRFHTRPRSMWGGALSKLQLIVPSPMCSVYGRTKDGKKSQHTLANTGSRRFLVIEQDAGSPDEQAAVLVHLAQKAPLVLAVHSGSKSIHGWFYCEGVPEDRLRLFMNYAVSIGADRATWTRSQFVRMPEGIRDNGKRQAVYFFNPEVMK